MVWLKLAPVFSLRRLGTLGAFCVMALSPAVARAQGTTTRTLRTDAEAGSQPKSIGSRGADEMPAGGLYGLESGPPPEEEAQQEGQQPAGTVPETHVVKKGDTLWALCQGYFQDPWRWPRLWADNPLITNPHWIFPGDVVRLQVAAATDMPPPAGGPAMANAPMIQTSRNLASSAVALREIGFVDPEQLAAAGYINGSREEKIMLATHDQVYVAFSAQRPLRAGDRYTIYVPDEENPVRDPSTGKHLGYIVHIYGDIGIDQITDGNIARGTLLDLRQPVERNYRVGPLYRQFRHIEPRVNSANIEGRILGTLLPNQLIGFGHFVIIDKGKNAGVEVGNRLFIVRRGDGYRPIMADWTAVDDRFPKEVVGELLTVHVRDDLSVAWLSRSNKEIRIGDVVEMRRGY